MSHLIDPESRLRLDTRPQPKQTTNTRSDVISREVALQTFETFRNLSWRDSRREDDSPGVRSLPEGDTRRSTKMKHHLSAPKPAPRAHGSHEERSRRGSVPHNASLSGTNHEHKTKRVPSPSPLDMV
jgi:hypothetical protein